MKRWIYLPIALGLIALGVAAYSLGAMLRPPSAPNGTAVLSRPDVGAVTLEGNDGPVRLSDYRGEVLLVFFGYTRCPDVCPLTLARLAKTYRDLEAPDDLQVVMVTVDPSHDTPAAVQRYAAGFHPDFIGLGGSPEAIVAAAKPFFVGYRSAGGGAAEVSHTDAVMVVDRQGRLRRVYSADDVVRLERDLPALLADRGWDG